MQETVESPTSVKDKTFPVLEVFGPTLQGEGATIGVQTMFVRLGGCDYRCTMCDSLHAVLPQEIKAHATHMTQGDIFHDLKKKAGHCKTVTLSGGNPCMWDIKELVAVLRLNRWRIYVETQGTIWQDWLNSCTVITISPKGPGMGERFEVEKFRRFVDCIEANFNFKVVIFDQRDIEFAKGIVDLYPLVPIFLSLGNPYPPHPNMEVSNNQQTAMKIELLDRMRSLFDDIAKEPMLARARFLPQMHVLLWGNDRGR